jgi:hypothetical protein
MLPKKLPARPRPSHKRKVSWPTSCGYCNMPLGRSWKPLNRDFQLDEREGFSHHVVHENLAAERLPQIITNDLIPRAVTLRMAPSCGRNYELIGPEGTFAGKADGMLGLKMCQMGGNRTTQSMVWIWLRNDVPLRIPQMKLETSPPCFTLESTLFLFLELNEKQAFQLLIFSKNGKTKSSPTTIFHFVG